MSNKNGTRMRLTSNKMFLAYLIRGTYRLGWVRIIKQGIGGSFIATKDGCIPNLMEQGECGFTGR